MNYQEILKAVEEAVASSKEINDLVTELSAQKDETWQIIVEAQRRYNTVSQELREAKTIRKDLSKALDALRAKLVIRIDAKEVE